MHLHSPLSFRPLPVLSHRGLSCQRGIHAGGMAICNIISFYRFLFPVVPSFMSSPCPSVPLSPGLFVAPSPCLSFSPLQSDSGTMGQGDIVTYKKIIRLAVSLSPCPPVTPSPLISYYSYARILDFPGAHSYPHFSNPLALLLHRTYFTYSSHKINTSAAPATLRNLGSRSLTGFLQR
jgi:hypothetical protein